MAISFFLASSSFANLSASLCLAASCLAISFFLAASCLAASFRLAVSCLEASISSGVLKNPNCLPRPVKADPARPAVVEATVPITPPAALAAIAAAPAALAPPAIAAL